MTHLHLASALPASAQPPQSGSDDKVVMMFAGEYDLSCRDRLRRDFERLSNVQDVILDLTDVTYVDSTFIAELMRLNGTRSSLGRARETIVVGNQGVRRVFDILSLGQAFSFATSLEQVATMDGRQAALYYAHPGE